MSASIVVVSDLHVGSKLALCPPGPINLKDGAKYTPTRTQGQLWEWWQDFADGIPKDKPWWLVVNGDAVDGVHIRSELIIRPSVAFQSALAVRCLDELIGRGPGHPERIFFTRGTGWHVGTESDQEEPIAAELGAEKDPLTGGSTFWHLIFDKDGTRFDFKHHPRTKGMMPHTKGPGINRLAFIIQYARLEAGLPVPDLAIRSHVHFHQDSGSVNYKVQAITTPAWKIGFDGYVNKIGFEQDSHIGGLYVNVEEGQPHTVTAKRYSFGKEAQSVWTP